MVSLARRLLLLLRNAPSWTSDPSGNASTWAPGTVTELVRALLYLWRLDSWVHGAAALCGVGAQCRL